MRNNPTTGPVVSALHEKKYLEHIAQITGPVLDLAFPWARCLIFTMLCNLGLKHFQSAS